MTESVFTARTRGVLPLWVDRRVPYDSATRRRARGLGRVAAAAIHPRFYPTAPVAHAFWFDGIANFGDQLTPWLLRRLGVIPVHATARTADLCGVGSVLEMLPPASFDGAVWGSGLLDGARVDLPQARWAAVRGALTRDLVGADVEVALGDPGLLVSRLARRPRRRHALGLIPHHAHVNHPSWARLAQQPGSIAINVRRHPTAVIRDIAACELVVSSSLHGLAIADSYGIPAVRVVGMTELAGGDFKFRDYLSALPGSRDRCIDGVDLVDVRQIRRWAGTVDPDAVAGVQDGLIRVLAQVPLHRSSPPRAAVSLVRGALI